MEERDENRKEKGWKKGKGKRMNEEERDVVKLKKRVEKKKEKKGGRVRIGRRMSVED